MSFADAVNGFFHATGGGRQFGQDLAELYAEGRLGAQQGLALRDAEQEARRRNATAVAVPAAPQPYDPASGITLSTAEARAYRQQEAQDAPRRSATRPQTQQDLAGDASAEALYLTRYLPERVKALRSSGNGRLADRLEQYTASELGERHARGYASMVKAHAAGNFVAAAKAMSELQALSDEDTQARVSPDGNGGYRMRILQPSTGEYQDYQLDASRLTGDMGMFAFMDPAKMVARFDAHEKAKAANLTELLKGRQDAQRQAALKGLDFRYDVARDRLKYQQEIGKLVQQHQLDLSKPSDQQRVYAWLEKSGAPRAELDAYLGKVTGQGGQAMRQAPNPQDVARQYIAEQHQAMNDAFTSLPEDEQIRRATAYAQKLEAATRPAAPPASAGAGAGAAAGLPPIWRP